MPHPPVRSYHDVSTQNELTTDSRARVHPSLDAVKVTCMNLLSGSGPVRLYLGHGEAVRSALPGREVPRSGRRALDVAHRPRPAAGTRAIPGPPGAALRDPAEAARRPLAGNGASGAGGARGLLAAPAARLVRAHPRRARAGSRGGRPGDMGAAVRGSAGRPEARDVRTPDRAQAVLCAL